MNKAFTSYSSSERSEVELGLSVARLLTGAWRENFEPLNLTEDDLAVIVLQLCQSGAGALAWWRIRHTPLAASQSGFELKEVYHRFRLSALIHEQEIKHVFSLLRIEGIDAVLVKGWSIARLYPDRALRPYGDIDICVRPEQFAKTRAALKPLEKIDGHYVDLHAGFASIGAGGTPISRRAARRHPCLQWNELFERSELIDLGEEKVRVLGAEDHLRVLCLHFLRTGVWRPTWLCDVALTLETRAKDFNWEVCLGRDRRQADWVGCTLGLASQLLGADCKHTPVEKKARHLPRWLAPAVLAQWGRDRDPNERAMTLPYFFRQAISYRKLFT
ncbi:MAG TPA: nucleotidyltransferase family protein, partial [Pyrinomonadaceae bacterium]